MTETQSHPDTVGLHSSEALRADRSRETDRANGSCQWLDVGQLVCHELQLAGWKRVLLTEMEGGITAVMVTVANFIVTAVERITGWANVYAGYFSCGYD